MLEIKSLLRRKNQRLRAGKIEEANAISEKIGKMIIRYNSSSLTHLNKSHGTGAIWDAVNRLTGRSTSCRIPDSLTPDILNTHYSSISTIQQYVEPPPKISSTLLKSSISEFTVFKSLDNLSATATGPDDIPSWYLRTGAPIFSKPLSY